MTTIPPISPIALNLFNGLFHLEVIVGALIILGAIVGTAWELISEKLSYKRTHRPNPTKK